MKNRLRSVKGNLRSEQPELEQRMFEGLKWGRTKLPGYRVHIYVQQPVEGGVD